MMAFPLFPHSWLDLCTPVMWSVFSWRRRTAVSTDTHLTIPGAKVPGLKLSLALNYQGKEQSLKNDRIWHSCAQPIMLKNILIWVLTAYWGGIAISELLHEICEPFTWASHRDENYVIHVAYIDMYVFMGVHLHLNQSSWSLLIFFIKLHLYQQ